MAGGNSGGVESYLPIAAALAATVATDGAASPWLVEAMGTTAAGALTSGAAAAAASGLTAAVTGQDVGRSALTGAVTGGIGGALAGYGTAGAEGTTAATTPALTGSNVAGTAAVPTGAFTPAEIAAGVGTPATSGLPLTGAFTPAEVAAGQGTTTFGGLGVQGTTGANIPAGYTPGAESAGVGNWLSNNKGIAALGGTALLGALIQNDNKKYGVPSPASQEYSGPLTKLKYDPDKYTPVTTAQPSPAYQAQYPNYVRSPYNAYAAEGGQVHSYADGGLLNPNSDPVDFMGGDMYPMSQQNRSYYATPTQAPTSAQQTMASYEPKTNPLTGQPTTHMAAGGIAQARRYDEGGATQAPQETQAQAPSLVDFTPFAGRYGMNQPTPQGAMTQDLVSRLAMRNAANPVPGQTPPVAPMQPAGIMAATPYSAPTFTRPEVATIPFANPKVILGTKEYNDEQARIAAEAEAKRQAEEAARFRFNLDPNPYAGGGAAGGLMPGALKYAAGGDISHLGGYSDGGRLLKGPGDGMSDNIPATIGAKQPARLADGEFVVPADVVSHLGNGSTDAGAKHLYAMMDKVRKARTGTKKQGKQIKPAKYLKA